MATESTHWESLSAVYANGCINQWVVVASGISNVSKSD